MREILSTYPYLLFSLLLLAIALGLLALLPQGRARAICCGLMSAPGSLLSFAFVPEYWQAARVGGAELGAEDLLFSFATGVIGWVIAERLVGGGVSFEPLRWSGLRRYAVCVGLFLSVFLLGGWAARMRPMDATLVGAVAVAAWLLAPCRRLWRWALTAGLVFTLFYGSILKMLLLAAPEVLGDWTLGNLWGWSILGMPAEEIVWAAAYGVLLPLVAAHAFGARRIAGAS